MKAINMYHVYIIRIRKGRKVRPNQSCQSIFSINDSNKKNKVGDFGIEKAVTLGNPKAKKKCVFRVIRPTNHFNCNMAESVIFLVFPHPRNNFLYILRSFDAITLLMAAKFLLYFQLDIFQNICRNLFSQFNPIFEG